MNNLFTKMLSFRAAVWTVILLSIAIIIFHLLVLFRIIPYENVWAGRLKTIEEMYVFETISIIINAFLMFIVLIKGEIIRQVIPHKVISVLLWIFVALFFLNTLGNLTSKTSLETLIATPLTFILAILCLRIVINRKSKIVSRAIHISKNPPQSSATPGSPGSPKSSDTAFKR